MASRHMTSRSTLPRNHASGAPRQALSDRSNVPVRTSSVQRMHEDGPVKVGKPRLGKHSRTDSALSTDGPSGPLRAKVTATTLATRRRLGSGISSSASTSGASAAGQSGIGLAHSGASSTTSAQGPTGWTETDATTPQPDDDMPSADPMPSSPCPQGDDAFPEPNLDPDHLFSLSPDMEAAAQQAVAAIKARYRSEVLIPALERAREERMEAVRNGTMLESVAAYENHLSDMGLDPDEERDTTMAAEYAEEVFTYMSQCEITTMPNPHYMNFQNEMDWPLRQTLVDWLMQIHVRFHMLPETLWIAINLVDRFLSVRVVSLPKLQLVGVTAMFIASKYEEIMAPTLDEMLSLMATSTYTRDEILKGERIILSTLDFNVSKYCSPYSWVRRISKADEYDVQTRTLCKFLIECTLLDHRFLRVKPSTIAAIGMFLAKKMLGGEWNDAFVYYSGFTAEQLLPGANMLLERLLDPTFEEMFVCKKYSSRKFLRASAFARDWVRAHVGGSLDPATVAALQIVGEAPGPFFRAPGQS